MPKILTIDDSKTIRMIIQRAFKEYDCTVLEAANGDDGLKAAAEHKPDIIILDITMPHMDGIQMLTHLRERGDQTPVVMLTAEGGATSVQRAQGLGIAEYIAKPFQNEALVEKVSKVLPLARKAA
ncbi:MAG TPA: response regulator [Opitutaceae bacterium]|nr:response regulator [Opitutaceae bacterium]